MRPQFSVYIPSHFFAVTCGQVNKNIVDINPRMTGKQKNELRNRIFEFTMGYHGQKLDLSNLNITTVPTSIGRIGRIKLLTLSPNFTFSSDLTLTLKNIQAITINKE